MEQFCKRFNKVSLENVALQTQKQTLQQENENLKIILKQYLEGISVSEELLSRRNPLFVINGRTNAPYVIIFIHFVV